MSKKLYDYVIKNFENKTKNGRKYVDGIKKDWLEADYAAFIDWGSGHEVQPLKRDGIEELIKDQMTADEDRAYTFTLYDEDGEQYLVEIRNLGFEWNLEKC